jgi:hypothetical protein
VPEGVWDGESRHVVHSLPLEEGLPEVHRLSPPEGMMPKPLQPRLLLQALERASPSEPHWRPRESPSRNHGGIIAEKQNKKTTTFTAVAENSAKSS